MIPYLGTILLSLAIDNFRIRYVYYMQGSRFVVRYGRKGQGLIISSITRANRASFLFSLNKKMNTLRYLIRFDQ